MPSIAAGSSEYHMVSLSTNRLDGVPTAKWKVLVVMPIMGHRQARQLAFCVLSPDVTLTKARRPALSRYNSSLMSATYKGYVFRWGLAPGSIEIRVSDSRSGG